MPTLVKPQVPRLYPSVRPRGLQVCIGLTPDLKELARSPLINPAAGTMGVQYLTNSPYGVGLAVAGTTANVGHSLTSGQPATTYTLEALIYVTGSTGDGSICGWNGDVTGNSGTYDRTLQFASPNWQVFHYDGGVKAASGGSASAGKLTHLIGTYDGSNLLTLYLDGRQVAQTSGVAAPYTGYATPAFVAGRSNGGGLNFASGIILFANFYTVCLTPTEVLARAADPFGMFAPPPRQVLSFTAPAAPTAVVPVLGGLTDRGLTGGRLAA